MMRILILISISLPYTRSPLQIRAGLHGVVGAGGEAEDVFEVGESGVGSDDSPGFVFLGEIDPDFAVGGSGETAYAERHCSPAPTESVSKSQKSYSCIYSTISTILPGFVKQIPLVSQKMPSKNHLASAKKCTNFPIYMGEVEGATRLSRLVCRSGMVSL